MCEYYYVRQTLNLLYMYSVHTRLQNIGSEMVMNFYSNCDIVLLIYIHAAAVCDLQTNVLFITDSQAKSS